MELSQKPVNKGRRGYIVSICIIVKVCMHMDL
jgi:hypothetical protein